MKIEISETLRWSDKAKAYAAAFREGDAVKIGDKWHEVKRYTASITSTVFAESNPYNLNYDIEGKGHYEGVAKGFLKSRVDSPYEIVRPKDYEVQAGDKIVWLGETIMQGDRSELTFGKTYEVFMSEDGSLIYKNDMTIMLLASYLKEKSSMWGVIPRYENVKAEDEMKTEMSEVSKKDEVGKVYPSKFLGKYSVGDEVVLSNGGVKAGDASNGARGIVLEVDKNDEFCPYYVKFEGDNKNEGADIIEWCNEAELDLIESENVKVEEEMNEKTELVDEAGRSRKFKVGDIVEVVGEANKHYISQSGVVVHVDCYDDKLPYEVDFLEGSVWLNDKSLRKVGESFITSTPKASTPKAEYTTKIKTIQGSVGQLESFDERVNEFMQDKDIVGVSHSFVTDISGLENIIAVITYRCSKTEE